MKIRQACWLYMCNDLLMGARPGNVEVESHFKHHVLQRAIFVSSFRPELRMPTAAPTNELQLGPTSISQAATSRNIDIHAEGSQ